MCDKATALSGRMAAELGKDLVQRVATSVHERDASGHGVVSMRLACKEWRNSLASTEGVLWRTFTLDRFPLMSANLNFVGDRNWCTVYCTQLNAESPPLVWICGVARVVRSVRRETRV